MTPEVVGDAPRTMRAVSCQHEKKQIKHALEVHRQIAEECLVWRLTCKMKPYYDPIFKEVNHASMIVEHQSTYPKRKRPRAKIQILESSRSYASTSNVRNLQKEKAVHKP